MKKNWKRLALPVALVLLMLAALSYDLIFWQPHGNAGLLSGMISLATCIYAVVVAVRSFRAEARRGFIAAICLLALAAVVLWISEMIPFCPECDGGIDSPLMRCIYADWL